MGLTGQELAAAVGVSKSFVSAVERGHSMPSCEMLAGLNKAFDIDPIWLLTGTGQTTKNQANTKRSRLGVDLDGLAKAILASPDLLEMIDVQGVGEREQSILKRVRSILMDGDRTKIRILQGLLDGMDEEDDAEQLWEGRPNPRRPRVALRVIRGGRSSPGGGRPSR